MTAGSGQEQRRRVTQRLCWISLAFDHHRPKEIDTWLTTTEPSQPSSRTKTDGDEFSLRPRSFEGGKLIIERKVVDPKDHVTTTHGWVKDPDPGTYARRVHKLPILCWPILEELANALKPESLA